MSLPFPVNIAAECLRAGCCILGDKKKRMTGGTPASCHIPLWCAGRQFGYTLCLMWPLVLDVNEKKGNSRNCFLIVVTGSKMVFSTNWN